MTDEVDVYLDVDGVLNAVTGSLPQWGWSAESHRCTRVNGFLISWSTELIDRLNALAVQPHVNFHWLTTWLRDAPEILADKIGLHGKDWPVIGETQYASISYPDWWKLSAAQTAATESGRRVVWIDDDLSHPPAREWAVTLGESIMLVQPDTRVGVTKDMMDMIEAWV